MDHEQLLIELRKDHEYLRKEVEEIKHDVREMHEHFLRWKGWIGGALFVASCVGAFGMAVFHYFIK